MASSPHVLIVDDSCMNRELVSDFLKSYDIRVTSIVDPQDALEFLDTEHDVNLIVTSYHMPEVTGYEILKQVKDSPRLRHIPVVIFFTHYTPEEFKKSIDAGAVEYVRKPISLIDMARLLKHI